MPIFNGSLVFQPAPGQPVRPSPQALIGLGPIVPLQVGIPKSLASILQAASQPIPPPVPGIGIVDTGAGSSCVDDGVVQKLGIQPVGVANVGTAGGLQTKATYPARFLFPGTNLPSMEFTSLIGADLSSFSTPGSPQLLIALIGRDILSRFVLVYNGAQGMFTLAY